MCFYSVQYFIPYSKKKIIIQESKTELVKMLMFINKLIITFISTKMNKSKLGEFFIFFFFFT